MSLLSSKPKQPQLNSCPRNRLNPIMMLNKKSKAIIIIKAALGNRPNIKLNPTINSINGTIIASIFIANFGKIAYPYMIFANPAGS